MSTRVHKFGGTSLADTQRLTRAASIVLEDDATTRLVVVSAMGGVTDALFSLCEQARAGDESFRAGLDAIRTRHVETAAELLTPDGAHVYAADFDRDVEALDHVFQTILLAGSHGESLLDLISGYGELWSARLFAAHMAKLEPSSNWLDARKVLVVEHGELGPLVDWSESTRRMKQALKELGGPPKVLVVTGFVASLADGTPTTLKRNGSDYSASIFAALAKAERITIWTDVKGVLSADPRRVPEAVILPELTYREAAELAYFGAKVLHPNTMAPAVGQGIEIYIRSSLDPSAPGTRIAAPDKVSRLSTDRLEAWTDPSQGQSPVLGLSTIDGVALVNVEGTGMVGVPGVAERLFGALRAVNISVVMISQGSSEHSICCAVPDEQAEQAERTAKRAFSVELAEGLIDRVDVAPNCSVLAAVGATMAHTTGVSARFFGALGRAGVNVRAIAQGSSEINISAVVNRADAHRALRAVHASFYLSEQTLSVGLIGPGLVGGTVLEQLSQQAGTLKRQFHIDVRLRGIASSKKMLLSDGGLDFATAKAELAAKGVPLDLDAFAAHVKPDHLPHAAIVECTSSMDIARRYGDWLDAGIHVVTPNKKAGAGPIEEYRRIKRKRRGAAAHFLYEATVGAGLPIITTLRDLVQTGDEIRCIEGVLSGTLSYVFNTFHAGVKFSDVVKTAKEQGFTEPDPRDDLSGMDVARKLVILARESGIEVSLEDIEVENLVPKELAEAESIDAFMGRLSELDAGMQKRAREAEAANECLRYVGIVGRDVAPKVQLKRYPKSHPFAGINGSDNILAFHTARYRDTPLVVQGPGAGPDVTAAGVFADLLRLGRRIGAPS